MKTADSWKVFSSLFKLFENHQQSGATPHDFHLFLTSLRNGMPDGADTVMDVLALDGVAQHEEFLMDHAKEELSRILT